MVQHGRVCSASLRSLHTERRRTWLTKLHKHAARAAGDAASAAYLHPLAKATQVGHILRAAASAARAAELSAGDDPDVGSALIEQARRRANPVLVDVLSRYPFGSVGKSRVAHLMKTLDASLRMHR